MTRSLQKSSSAAQPVPQRVHVAFGNKLVVTAEGKLGVCALMLAIVLVAGYVFVFHGG